MDPTESNPASFDDPVLRGAIRRTWGAERAPEALRARVMSLVGDAAAQPVEAKASPAVVASIRPSRWRHPWIRYGLAAAAMVVVGFGIAYTLDNRPFPGGPSGNGFGTEVTLASALPPPIAKGLVDSHDRCTTYPSHNGYPELSRENFEAMRRRLQEQLGFPVIAGPISDALDRGGWKFRGAAICKVGDVEAAHLVFVRDGQAISVFSLPRSCCQSPGKEPRECEDANPDHPIALFVWSDGLHCVVGSSSDRSLSVDEVRGVLEHLRPTITGAGPARP